MQSETPVASHATPHFWRKTQMKTLQARQVDLSRPRRSLALRPNIFHYEIHEVDLWQVYHISNVFHEPLAGKDPSWRS